MGKKRCQVCDGPVVNGRCKLCGMPYRNDEILYHLNESRSDHYSHATGKARAIMRQEEIPLGDRKPGAAMAGKNNKQSTAVTGKNNKQSTAVAGKNNKQSTAVTGKNYKKKKKGSLLGWLIMLAVICMGVPEIREVFQDEILPVIEQELGTSFGSSASYILRPGDALSVGNDDWDDILPGQYAASCENGFVNFMILGDDGETGNMTVNDGEECKITLKDGDMIGIISSETKDAALLLTAR